MHWVKIAIITIAKTELISHVKNPVGHFDSPTSMRLSYDKINTRVKKYTHLTLWKWRFLKAELAGFRIIAKMSIISQRAAGN